ncbi:hypothetical protein [Polaribacter cellanae]|uniref:Uncharacterized protein n=1 Tax=Polaribacter cellanae TaxID=2818493 RepID=A0A975H577_9FLAO|nr:hypothetical protein [Polaribacter cellanae]QTE21121.1 hypothetical protein J3359_09685 [Polaribacter cellanae]
MKTTNFPYNNVQAYLDAIGVLEWGTAQDVENSRKEYRKLYLQHYQKRRYQSTHTNISISFSKKEKVILERLALEQGKKLTGFLKDIALLYAETNSIHTANIRASKTTTEIKQLFSLGFDVVEELAFENSYPELSNSYQELLQLFKQLETLLNQEF